MTRFAKYVAALFVLALLPLATLGCRAVESQTRSGEKQSQVTYGVYKFCDSGNLLYTYQGYGIAVVPNAKECHR